MIIKSVKSLVIVDIVVVLEAMTMLMLIVAESVIGDAMVLLNGVAVVVDAAAVGVLLVADVVAVVVT